MHASNATTSNLKYASYLEKKQRRHKNKHNSTQIGNLNNKNKPKILQALNSEYINNTSMSESSDASELHQLSPAAPHCASQAALAFCVALENSARPQLRSGPHR